MKTIEIAACTDRGFIMPTGVMMRSVCRNNESVRFHLVVDESVTEEDKADLREAALSREVLFYTIDSQVFNSLPTVDNIPRSTYYRLLMPQVLPESIQKILFLDGDIIVRHSLRPLWETDLSGVAIAAVTDADESKIEKYNRQKYLPSYGHFNAGVMLINLDYWRANDIRGEIESYMKDHVEDIRYCDQDILNYVLKDKKKTLPITYNVQTCFLWVLEKACYDYWKYEAEVLEARRDPAIIHYNIGNVKPWMEGSAHPFKSSFLKYQDETKWKGVVWMRPKRPFMTKLLSRINEALMKFVVKTGLWKTPFKKPEKTFLDLEPVD